MTAAERVQAARPTSARDHRRTIAAAKRPANVIHLTAGRPRQCFRWHMPRRATAMLLLLAALQGGCGRDSGEKTEPRTPMPSGLAGVYAGELPCSNCAKIEATLWLRPDGRFFLRQRFVDDTDI